MAAYKRNVSSAASSKAIQPSTGFCPLPSARKNTPMTERKNSPQLQFWILPERKLILKIIPCPIKTMNLSEQRPQSLHLKETTQERL